VRKHVFVCVRLRAPPTGGASWLDTLVVLLADAGRVVQPRDRVVLVRYEHGDGRCALLRKSEVWHETRSLS
jgi:hypothetical protein